MKRRPDPVDSEFVPPSQLRLHLKEPDYTRPLLKMSGEQRVAIEEKLTLLYGKTRAEKCFPEVERLMQVYYAHKTAEMISDDRVFDQSQRFTEKDVVLITYGDLVKRRDTKPLRALTDILKSNKQYGINTLHILPFFPSSSDRGFSIVNYEEVDPRLGTWEEIEELSLEYRLMFDGVFNHVSSKSHWFQEFLNGNPRYYDYFIKFSTRQAIPEDYLQLVLRPRTSDLLTGFDTIRGRHYVWTTFGPDQIDLNYQNEEVLLQIIEVLLYYVRRGADIIRLDAVTYMWTELGTPCALLEESHILVQLYRAILDVVAPHVALITETNVPHEQNISYFGDGFNEAQMVYNFALPPLVLRAFQTGSCERLTQWATSLKQASDRATYFNFLDSHDGIGLMAVQDILSAGEIAEMIEVATAHGGLISWREDSQSRKRPYEINITWFSALNRPDSGESLDTQVNRFIASRSIALALTGVPGIYLPSLVGSQNDIDEVLKGGGPRAINRGSVDEQALIERLRDPGTAACRILDRFGELIRKRRKITAFHPNARQRILAGNTAVFAVLRQDPRENQVVLALTNITGRRQQTTFDLGQLPSGSRQWNDVLSTEVIGVRDGKLFVTLGPYGVRWLMPAAD